MIIPFGNFAVRAAVGGGVTSLTFVTSASSTTATITVPATAQAGDIAFLIESASASGGPIPTTPSGWTEIVREGVSGVTGRLTVIYRKVLSSGDISSSIGAISSFANTQKYILVFRPNATISTVTDSTFNKEYSAGSAPASQSILASGGTPPLIVLAVLAGTVAGSFTTASPAFDGTVGSTTRCVVGYKVYNSSPANHTVATGDNGNENTLISGYVSIA